MKTGLRLVLAMSLMLLVILATNWLFPPIVPDPPPEGARPVEAVPGEVVPEPGRAEPGGGVGGLLGDPEAPREELVTVETPLYTITFSNRGGAARSIRLAGHRSFARDGPVELVPDGATNVLAGTWRLGAEQLDLTRIPYEIEPAGGIRLGAGAGPRTLTFRYDHPTEAFTSELRYTFSSDSYVVGVEGKLPAMERASLFVDLGTGPAINELREADDRRMLAFSGNHVAEGINARPLGRVREPEVMQGPLLWAAVKSKYFVQAILAGEGAGGQDYLAGVWADPVAERDRAAVRVGMPVEADGGYAYRAYLGPIEPETLRGVADDLDEVNPVGWIFGPIVRPFVGIIHWTVDTLHDRFNLGYAWVLIVIGVLVRVLLWPLNQKAMRSQMKMQAIQPLAMEIREKYSDDPHKMNQETMKLYRENKVNPLGGCLPMLIPWPVLIALFFVFQNTIQLRGVPFLWLPDLSSPDPLYVLPVFLGVSMFLLQFISMRAMAASNPQMKMMMYILPVVMMFIFFRLASGLNLYYAAFNVATIPQQILIARERKKAQPAAPSKPRR